ncbi:hypothetical protein AURDEDRAFT_164020 [Auricularia subglabra TFB-10046 SS5]|nr:hypothetical protein AURDEDRAFT_164020 [Auricularia subglabra TFB-10046 SS5]
MRFFSGIVSAALLLISSVISAPSGAPTCTHICPYQDNDLFTISLHFLDITGNLFCSYPKFLGDTLHFCIFAQVGGGVLYASAGTSCGSGAPQQCAYSRKKRANLVDYVRNRRAALPHAEPAPPAPAGGRPADSMPEEFRRALEAVRAVSLRFHFLNGIDAE